jgi:hypothetical protein
MKRGCEKTKLKFERGLEARNKTNLFYLNPSCIPDLGDEASGACVSSAEMGSWHHRVRAIGPLLTPRSAQPDADVQNPIFREKACYWLDEQLVGRKTEFRIDEEGKIEILISLREWEMKSNSESSCIVTSITIGALTAGDRR